GSSSVLQWSPRLSTFSHLIFDLLPCDLPAVPLGDSGGASSCRWEPRQSETLHSPVSHLLRPHEPHRAPPLSQTPLPPLHHPEPLDLPKARPTAPPHLFNVQRRENLADSVYWHRQIVKGPWATDRP